MNNLRVRWVIQYLTSQCHSSINIYNTVPKSLKKGKFAWQSCVEKPSITVYLSVWAYNAAKVSLLEQFRTAKTPYLLPLALTKFLFEFINQPIRSGGQSDFYCPARILREFILCFDRKFQSGTTFRKRYAASAVVAVDVGIRCDWVGAFWTYFP